MESRQPVDGSFKEGKDRWRAPESENKMPGGINLVSFHALEGREAKDEILRAIGRQIKVRQNDHLAFTVTMVSGTC
jgi:hypothetical protein